MHEGELGSKASIPQMGLYKTPSVPNWPSPQTPSGAPIVPVFLRVTSFVFPYHSLPLWSWVIPLNGNASISFSPNLS